MTVVGIDSFTLLVHRCRCGHLVIDGFFHQLRERKSERQKYRITLECPCSECGLIYLRRLRLTSGRGHRRLIDWFQVLYCLNRIIPGRLKIDALGLCLWLNKRVRL